MTTNIKKWQITLFSTFIFIIIINPYTYNLTNSLLQNTIGQLSNNGCPTNLGIIIHTIVFALIVRYSMDLDLF